MARRDRSIERATRSATSCSRRTSPSLKLRCVRLPTCSTPTTVPSTISVTPSRERTFFSRISGLTTVTGESSRFGMTTGSRVAATRPANPRATGSRKPRSTSSSSPLAALAARVRPSSSTRRTAAVSAFRMSVTRSRSSSSRSSRSRYASVASVTRSTSSSRAAASSADADSPGISSWFVGSGVIVPGRSLGSQVSRVGLGFAVLFGRDRGVGLDLLRDDHQEVPLGVPGEPEDALGLLGLIGCPQLVGVVAEQVLEVELALRVELLEHDLGALAEAALDRLAIEVELVVYPHVHTAAGHPGARPRADVAEDDGTAGGHVLEGEP